MKLANLLPEQDKKLYQKYLTHLYMRRFLYSQALMAVVLIAILAGFYIFYAVRIQTTKDKIADLENFARRVNLEDMRATAASHNQGIKAAAAVLKARANFSALLDEFGKLVPGGVTVDSIRITSSPAGMDVRGRAKTRELVVLLQNRLESSSAFSKVYAPLANLTEAQNGSFQFVLSFDLQKLIFSR